MTRAIAKIKSLEIKLDRLLVVLLGVSSLNKNNIRFN